MEGLLSIQHTTGFSTSSTSKPGKEWFHLRELKKKIYTTETESVKPKLPQQLSEV